MIPDSENSKPDETKPPEPSPEPSPSSESPFIPNIGLRELTATWEMLVNFKAAIRENMWPGNRAEAVAMGLSMISQMESQYRAQVEMARAREKESSKAARAAIHEQGGTINGEKPVSDGVPA